MERSVKGVNKLRRLLHRKCPFCHYCGVYMTFENGHKENAITADHVIPRSLGGSDHISNLIGVCSRCNAARGVLPYKLYLRYVQRYGRPRDHHMATRNWYRRRGLRETFQLVKVDGLNEEWVNTILGDRIREWKEKRK